MKISDLATSHIPKLNLECFHSFVKSCGIIYIISFLDGLPPFTFYEPYLD